MQTVVQVNTDPSNPNFVPPSPTFALGDSPTYYEITTNATFSGPITICLAYPPNAFPAGTVPRLFHFVSNQWMDVTSSTDTVARVVCGSVTSLSPLALGFLVVNRGRSLVLKRLALSSSAVRGKGSWSLQAKLNASTAAASFLGEVDANGIEFELVGRAGSIDKVTFAPGDCSLRRRQAVVVCRVKNQTDAVKAAFKRQGGLSKGKTLFSVSASFTKRRFNNVATTTKWFSALAPLEVQVTTTPASLGVVAANTTKCHASATKLRCK